MYYCYVSRNGLIVVITSNNKLLCSYSSGQTWLDRTGDLSLSSGYLGTSNWNNMH
jgi:hypothetical protein